MLTYHACSKCDARVRRSRIRNVLEFVISPLVLPWRCSVCDRREYKFRYIDMNPPANPNEDDEEEGEDTEVEVVKPVVKQVVKPVARPVVKAVAKPVVTPDGKPVVKTRRIVKVIKKKKVKPKTVEAETPREESEQEDSTEKAES